MPSHVDAYSFDFYCTEFNVSLSRPSIQLKLGVTHPSHKTFSSLSLNCLLPWCKGASCNLFKTWAYRLTFYKYDKQRTPVPYTLQGCLRRKCLYSGQIPTHRRRLVEVVTNICEDIECLHELDCWMDVN